MSDINLTEAQAIDRIEEVMQILKVRQMCMDDPTHEDVVDYRERYRSLQMAVEALEKREKYKWHDLRVDPDDLPVHWEEILFGTVHGLLHIGAYDRTFELFIKFMDHSYVEMEKSEVVAWKYIEPEEIPEEWIKVE